MRPSETLESQSIHILREVAAEAAHPVLLYSMGKDSAVLLHLARKAFYPGRLPFPLLHVDTGWKFAAMYAERDRVAAQADVDLRVHINAEAAAQGINPFDHGSQRHTDLWKTQGLKQAMRQYGFDAAFGGARRDEEKSRAKERVVSFRDAQQRWDPRRQRPELWRLFNTHVHAGESLRVFPLSDWTELDVWHYIDAERIEVVPLYFAAERPVVEREGALIVADDGRMRFRADEVAQQRTVRFRTLGCWPLTGAIESAARTPAEIVAELERSSSSERRGRLIDHDGAASMERKKHEGYF